MCVYTYMYLYLACFYDCKWYANMKAALFASIRSWLILIFHLRIKPAETSAKYLDVYHKKNIYCFNSSNSHALLIYIRKSEYS